MDVLILSITSSPPPAKSRPRHPPRNHVPDPLPVPRMMLATRHVVTPTIARTGFGFEARAGTRTPSDEDAVCLNPPQPLSVLSEAHAGSVALSRAFSILI